MKVLLNKCYGGYGFSKEFVTHLIKNDIVSNFKDIHYISRHNPRVIKEAIAFGLDKASGICAELEIREIPDGANYHIHEYDGMECINDMWIEVTTGDLRRGLTTEQLDMVAKGCSIKCSK